MEIYVSTKGNDLNSGEKSAPLKALECAVKKAKEYENCTVFIEEGRYAFEKSLKLTKEDSNLSFKASGKVIFDGGIILDNEKIENYKDNIKMIDLSYLGITLHELGNRGFRRAYHVAPNEFFVNSQAQQIARYPKKGLIGYEKDDIIEKGSWVTHFEYDCKKAVVRIRDEHIKKWANANHAYLAGNPSEAWADECVKIEKIDVENQTITTSQPHLWTYSYTGHSGWYIVNLLEELTDEGEYYIDIDKKILYFIPAKDTDLKTAVLQLSVLDKPIVSVIDGDNITFEGITFENTRATGVYIEGGDGCIIKNCEFHNIGLVAIQVGQGATPLEHGLNNCHGYHSEKAKPFLPLSEDIGSWNEYIYEFAAWDNKGGKNHKIEGCKIYDTGTGGILLGGGNRKKLIPANNTVYNCEFYRVNRLDRMYKAAVNLMGVGNVISHCLMYDLPGMAIYMHGNDHIIEYNDISDCVKETSDSGAIYMGRDMSEVGNIFRNNYFHDIKNNIPTALGTCAIYLDDWDIFNAVYDNFFYNIQGGGFGIIHHTCGGLLSFSNNFVIDCVPGVMFDNMSNSYIKMHSEPLYMTRVHTTDENDMRGVDVTSDAYRKKYPYLYDAYMNDARFEWMYYNNTYVYHKYDAFVDGEHEDFTQVESFGETNRNEFDWKRRTDPVMGYKDDLVLNHKVDFKSIGLVK